MIGRLTAAVLVLLAAGCTQPTTTSHFDSEGISFDYPSTWNSATFDMPSNFEYWWVWLSTEPLADPCDRVSDSGMTSISCERSPVVGKLRPGGLLADWSSNGWPGWTFKSNAGESIRVGNMQSTLEVIESESGCLSIGGQTQLPVITPSEAAGNWMQRDACVNGAFTGTVESQIRAMLASVEKH